MKRIVGIVYVFLCWGISLHAQSVRVIETLKKLEMENISVVEKSDTITAAFETSVYRGAYNGIGIAIRHLVAMPEMPTLQLVILDNALPQLCITLPAKLVQQYQSGEYTLDEVYRNMEMTTSTGTAMRRLKGIKREDSTFGKVDLVLYPGVMLVNNVTYKLYMAILLFAGILTSCKVGKSYVRPDLHLPDSLAQHQDSVSFGDQDWKDIYADSTLCSLIDRALEHNKDMLIAAARVKEMAAQKRISTAALLPDIKGKVTAERELENHGGDAFKKADTFEAQFLVSWELDLWGNLRWARSASIAEYLQSIEAQRALRMTIVAEVAQAYYELVALDTELDIVKQTLKAREEGVRLARIRFAGGLTSETSYRQAQVELARTATLVPDLERKISLKENDIAFLAGEYPNRIARSRLLQEFNFPETLPVGLPSTLLERRPDIRQAEQKLIAANAKVGVAYTNMFPRLALTGGFGTESTSLSELLKSPYAVMEGALLTPIFGWGKNRAALKAKKAAFEGEVHNYEKSVLTAFKETRNAIVNFNKIKEVYELRANLERSAKSYMDLAQLQYINGVINYLDVLDAQRGYFDAQIGLSNAIRDELIAVVQLYKALGGGWKQ